MAVYTTITDLEAGKPITTGKMVALRENPIAIAEGAAGAPRIEPEAMDTAQFFTNLDADKLDNQHGSYYRNAGNMNAGTLPLARLPQITSAYLAPDSVDSSEIAENAVGASEIADGAVGRSHLNTTDGSGDDEVSTTGSGEFTLPGGSYGFYPMLKHPTSGDGAANMASDLVVTDFRCNIYMNATNGGTTTAKQRYINASPPFDLGDGEISLFVFVNVNKSGDVLSVYTSRVPPWAYNGPTDITGSQGKDGKKYKIQRKIIDYENAIIEEKKVLITNEFKNADMHLIPDPFPSAKPDTSIILLDPPETEKLFRLTQAGESINDLLHDGYLGIDNDKLNRKCPRDVCAHKWKWKKTKR